MFASYAVTFICTIFTCTPSVIQSPSLVEYKVTPWNRNSANSGIYFVPINEYNVSNNYVAVNTLESENSHKDPSQNENHLLIPVQDEPKIEDIKVLEKEFDEFPIVQIKDGRLKGFTMRTITNRSIAAFKSIPFAKPPVGQLRFKAPEKNSGWEGTLDAMTDSPTCIQADYIQQYKIHGQEDCLYLNVFSPKLPKTGKEDNVGLPVMVFIHGGGWFFSTSSLYGPAYLLDEDVILVSINYRLSMFGFLSTGDDASPGNNGLKDQTLALKWVRENIASFGGDPNRVTIFGESAGASSVHFHMFSPLSRGLFHGAISQSGCATCFWSISERATETARKYASFLNCTGTSGEIVECLRDKDATQLVATQLYLLEWTMYPVVNFGPVLEPSHPGAFLSELPESIYKRKGVAPVPWISGFNHDEGAINIAALFLNNQSLPQLNTEWDKYGPIFLDLKHSEANSVEIAEKVRNFYLGTDSINYNDRDKSIKMFSDRYVIACGVKGIQLHAQYSDQPVYAYRLAYKGKYSIVQLLGQKAQDWGVSHLDDLIYLFNNTEYYPKLSVKDDEYKMSKVVTSLWANFARTGRPYLTNGKEDPKNLIPVWDPVDPQRTPESTIDYYDINLQPKMIRDPFNDRVKFWRSLDLVDE